MGKYNRLIETVFIDLTKPNSHGNTSVEKFLDTDKDVGITESDVLKNCKTLYNEFSLYALENIERLSRIEEVIIQIRCKEMLHTMIKLEIHQGKSIYARSPFVRHGYNANDIRTMVGTVTTYGSNLDKLKNDHEFMDMCILKLKNIMSVEINNNMKVVDNIKQHSVYFEEML